MKILKRGQIPEEKIYRARCYYCDTEVEFQREEGRYTADQRDGDYLTVSCPVCKKDITINV